MQYFFQKNSQICEKGIDKQQKECYYEGVADMRLKKEVDSMSHKNIKASSKKPYYEKYWWVPLIVSGLALLRSFFRT